MILAFGDLHLGEHTYSKLQENGYYTNELECCKALEYIRDRAAKPDITMIIFTGDFFHTNHPKTNLIKYTIGWLKQMDKLNKPFYIITGNHDASTYSNALMFMHKLTLTNIKLIDSYAIDYTQITWNKYNIVFLPYVQDILSKNKDDQTNNYVSNYLNMLEDNTIVVAHIVESNATVGSEQRMLSKKVTSVDLSSSVSYSNVIFLLGHLHQYQQYTKPNGIKVVYTGSTTNNDIMDLGVDKGITLIDNTGNITFESIPNLRKFVKYIMPDDTEPLEFFKRLRIPKNSVVFVECMKAFTMSPELRELFTSKDISLGKIIIKSSKTQETMQINYKSIDPYEISSVYIKSLNLPNESDYIAFCHDKITKHTGDNACI